MKKRKRGFTFIELLVVITIILLVSSAGLLSYRAAQQRGRDGKRKADLEQVRVVLEMYRSDNGSYPVGDWSAAINSLKTGGYLGEEPVDPRGYSYYYSSSDGVSYQLCAALESEDPASCNASCGTVTCNYGVANP